MYRRCVLKWSMLMGATRGPAWKRHHLNPFCWCLCVKNHSSDTTHDMCWNLTFSWHPNSCLKIFINECFYIIHISIWAWVNVVIVHLVMVHVINIFTLGGVEVERISRSVTRRHIVLSKWSVWMCKVDKYYVIYCLVTVTRISRLLPCRLS